MNGITIGPISQTDVTGFAGLLAEEDETLDVATDRAERLMVQCEPLLVAREPGAASVIGWTGMVDRALELGGAEVPLVAGLAVDAGWRRRGIALRLLTELHRVGAVERPHAWLHSVINVRNGASIDLHQRAGFRVVARDRCFAGITFDEGAGLGVLLAIPTFEAS